ncbi:hypothetical protein M9H77_23806 [Catharanthus roseus]|uniref:Uncharacterized protein n=1 Tax=Catharanthus roseus TaxID=4058 RepID=A0ACC0AU26_CATRO|nr:hypothetical protein M9H77_23806 [Catharanthus roseus]
MLRGYNPGYDPVFGSVRGLHYTWLVLRKRVSSDGVDSFRLGRVDPLEERRSTVEDLAQSVYDDQRYSQPLKLGVKLLVRVSPEGHVFLFCSLMLEPFVRLKMLDYWIYSNNTGNVSLSGMAFDIG